MSRRVVTAALALAALVTGCASTVETAPARSATEQLLVARAADRAAETLVLPIPAGAKVFVDDSYFRAESAAYAVSAVRGSLSSAGYALSPDKAQADAVVDSLSQSGGGEGSGALQQHAGEKAEQFLQAVQEGFAQSTQTVFYGMAIAMILAGIVAVATIPRGKAPTAAILE